ncbi:MAG: glycosyltransferase [Paludibacter sp.]|nr:glycosyltransferase [Paludibacter sp.]
MKVFIINTIENSYSTGSLASGIGRKAKEQGWQVYFAHDNEINSSDFKSIRIHNSKLSKYLHIHFFTWTLDLHGLGSWLATYNLIRKIKKIKPNVIHLHNIHGYYINIYLLFKYLAKADIPIVWTLHDCWAMTGRCTHFSYIGCEKWKTQCEKCPYKAAKYEYAVSHKVDNSRINYNLKKKLFTSVKEMTMVPVSNWLGGIVEESYLSKYRIKVIQNGIDLKLFHPVQNVTKIKTKYGLNGKFILLGVASAWTKMKGFEDFIKLNSLLSDEYKIIMVGLSDQQLLSFPSDMIGVKKTKKINELVEIYSVADVILNLSYQESFGLTTIEGFACGIPGIVYNTTASPELITSETGYVVEPNNLDQLLDAINKIKHKGKSHYSAICRKRAEMYFDKEKQFTEYVELYNSFQY